MIHMVKILSYEDLEYMLIGAALLGAGGGGSLSEGFKTLSKVSDRIEIEDPEHIPNKAYAAVSAGMGSPLVAKYGVGDEHIYAFKHLEEYLGKKLEYVVPIELGAGNVARAIHTTYKMNRVLVDGDGAGRAVPQLNLITFTVFGIPIAPMTISDRDGNTAIILINDPDYVERLARSITAVFGGNAGIALYPMRGSDLKRAIVPKTLSRAIEIGKIIKNYRDKGICNYKEIAEKVSAYILGSGRVVSKNIETRGGFDYGYIEVKTENTVVKVYVKNENIVAIQNNKVLAMAPDLICWLSHECEPLTNADIDVDMDVAILGFKANEVLRNRRIIERFEAIYRELGLDLKYKPIEDLI